MNVGARLGSLVGVLSLGALGLGSPYTTRGDRQAPKADGPDFTFTAHAINDGFGYGIGNAGDFNHDGVPDVVISEPAHNGGANGRVLVYSTGTGQLLSAIDPPGNGGFFGRGITGIGDYDGDGISDIVVGSPRFGSSPALTSQGRILVFGGLNGRVLFTLNGEASRDFFGQTVAAGFDFNGDGIGDFAAAALTSSAVGKIYVLAGRTGEVLYSSAGEAPAGALGDHALSTAGDFDEDGYGDVVAGAGITPAVGKAFVYGGPKGRVICRLTDQVSGSEFGRGVAGAGDFDKDGRLDILVGAPRASGGGKVYVYSKGCALLATATAPPGQTSFGRSVAFIGDINGDGASEIAVGSQEGTRLTVVVCAGKSGAPLAVYRNPQPDEGSNYGNVLMGGLDFNRDGRPDLLVGAYSTRELGKAYFYYLKPPA